VVAARSVNVGDYVENMGNPRPIFRIVDNRVLELTVTVPTARLAGLAEGQSLFFTVDAIPGREFEGRISFINPAADEASRTSSEPRSPTSGAEVSLLWGDPHGGAPGCDCPARRVVGTR
jgi:multidrug resistance efflux pump